MLYLVVHKMETILTICHQTHLAGQVSCLSDSNEVWSDKLSDQNIRREPKGLSCICLVDCESDHDVRSISIWSDIREDH